MSNILLFFFKLDRFFSSFPMLQIYTDVTYDIAIFIGDCFFIHTMFSRNIVKNHCCCVMTIQQLSCKIMGVQAEIGI